MLMQQQLDLAAESLKTRPPHLNTGTMSRSGISGVGNSIVRRLRDPNFMSRYFVGHGIDIGAKGNNSLGYFMEFFPLIKSVQDWDIRDGDAQHMHDVSDGRYDFVHSSHCLEHIRDPFEALISWWRILKPGGHLVVLVPDEDMYEQGVWPSSFNGDHKRSFTTYKKDSWCVCSTNVIHLLMWLADRNDNLDIIKIERLTATFRCDVGRQDQSGSSIGEPAIEFIVRKIK
jgi:SAM-dependent methyltransferase